MGIIIYDSGLYSSLYQCGHKNIYIYIKFFFFLMEQGADEGKCLGTMKVINWPCPHPVLDSTWLARGGEVGCLLVPSFVFFHLPPVFLDQWRFLLPQGQFWLSQLAGRVLLVANEWSPKMLINILQCTGWPPPHRIMWPQRRTVPSLKGLWKPRLTWLSSVTNHPKI